MKKIILISLVIFFAISSRSWAGELDGKGLICEKNYEKVENNYSKTKIYYFENSETYSVIFMDNSIDPIKKRRTDKSYYISAATIYFYCSSYKFSLCGLDRKTLLLTFRSDMEIDYGEIKAKYQCEITDWSGILEHYKPALEKHKEEMKKNKI